MQNIGMLQVGEIAWNIISINQKLNSV